MQSSGAKPLSCCSACGPCETGQASSAAHGTTPKPHVRSFKCNSDILAFALEQWTNFLIRGSYGDYTSPNSRDFGSFHHGLHTVRANRIATPCKTSLTTHTAPTETQPSHETAPDPGRKLPKQRPGSRNNVPLLRCHAIRKPHLYPGN